VEFRILGPFEVLEAGKSIGLGGPKPRAILAMLLLEPNRAVSAERLVELIWGEDPPESAHNSLQVQVSSLRKALSPPTSAAKRQFIFSEPAGYVLRLERDQLDAARFADLTEKAEALRTAGELEASANRLAEALALWRGPVLGEFREEPWALAEASRLDEMRLKAHEDRLSIDLELGRHAVVLAELESLGRAHPLRERLQTLLMLALYRSGRQADASGVFHRTRERLLDELGMEPGPDMQMVFKQILKQDPGLKPIGESRTDNLPAQLTEFVGRKRELSEIKQTMAGHRLVTLTGPGGIGKTRLALQAAREISDEFRDGVWLVELAALADGGFIAQSIASMLGVREQAGKPLAETLSQFLYSRELLLVLDNCEHLIEAAARLTEQLLVGAPSLRMLATSREPLGIAGEISMPVPPLAVPRDGQAVASPTLEEFDAVALFCDRAGLVVPSFDLTEKTAPRVVEICQQLDGIPLAMELAAGKLKYLNLDQLSTRLNDRFRLLTGGSRTSLPRHQTLRAAIDWSFDLLTDAERILLRRLSVFAGSFTLEAAESICADDLLDRADIEGHLTDLASKSMLSVDTNRASGARYQLLETIRAYAGERLIQASEAQQTRDRHLDWYLALAERSVPRLRTGDQDEWLQVLVGEDANLRAAVAWAIAAGGDRGFRLVVALSRFWILRGTKREGRDAAEAVIRAGAEGTVAWARAMTTCAQFSIWQNDADRALELLARRLEFGSGLDGPDDPEDRASAIGYVSLTKAVTFGPSPDLLIMIRDSVARLRKDGGRSVLAGTLNNSGYMAFLLGERDQGRAEIEESLGIFEELGDRFNQVAVLGSLAQVAFAGGDLEEAGSCWRRVFRLNPSAYVLMDGAVFEGLAQLALAKHQPERTLILLGACQHIRSLTGATFAPADLETSVRAVYEEARRAVGAAADSLTQRGVGMALDEAIAYAMSDVEEPVMPAVTGNGG